MIASMLTQSSKVKAAVLSDSILSSPYLNLSLATWIPGLYEWRSIERMLQTTFDGQRPIVFDIDNVELPTATRRWKVSLAGYPEITFDDLRTGNWPKPTEEELEARSKALELAQEVHKELDIRPLTTSTIIRQLREGKVEKRG